MTIHVTVRLRVECFFVRETATAAAVDRLSEQTDSVRGSVIIGQQCENRQPTFQALHGLRGRDSACLTWYDNLR